MQTNINSICETLVLGANGKTGSRVASRLDRLGWSVRRGSRTAAIPFDWENESTWKPVLQGIESVYISFQPDLAVPGATDTIRKFSQLATENGIKKLVLLSGRGESAAQYCEHIIMNSGVDYTIVRASWFCQNFSESYFLEPVLAGYVCLPVGDIAEPFVSAEDIADVAVAALTTDAHKGQLYEVTGPRLLTFREAIQEIADYAGRQISYEEISMTAYASMLASYGVPQTFIALVSYLFTEVLDGRNAHTANGIEQALGRRATDFSEYAKKTSATGVWKQPAVL